MYFFVFRIHPNHYVNGGISTTCCYDGNSRGLLNSFFAFYFAASTFSPLDLDMLRRLFFLLFFFHSNFGIYGQNRTVVYSALFFFILVRILQNKIWHK